MNARPDWLEEMEDDGPYPAITASKIVLDRHDKCIVYDERFGGDSIAFVESDTFIGREAMR